MNDKMNRNEMNIRLLLKDLGKATQRGVRKCPKCSTFNGTRGHKCKNKSCNHSFKPFIDNKNDFKFNNNNNNIKSNSNERSKTCSAKKVIRNGLEAIRCLTQNNSSNIYSVRVRDRGPDYRGFVEVPIIQGLDGTSDPSLNASFIAETTARCFVEVCGSHKVVLPINSNDSSLNNVSNSTQNEKNSLSSNASNITLTIIESCLHIKHSVKCAIDAKPLTLKNCVLNMLTISNEMRQQIYELANDTTGPLVQRVSKNSMVVKCKPNNKYPLGYLHCWFAQHIHSSTNTHKSNSTPFRFSCSCKAFKSFKCSNSNNNNSNNETTSDNNTCIKSLEQRKCVHYYACICAFASHPNLTREFSHFIEKELPDFIANQESNSSEQNIPQNNAIENEEKDEPNSSSLVKKLKKDDRNEAINTRKLIDKGIISEFDISLTFVDWLSSVTELINQTMHYQLNGKPEPLVFKIPQTYFDCLQQRIATGLRKKRLPNITTVFTRKDCPPLGTFTKYTYFITNIIHVKQIFDTPQLSLEITQSFIQNRDGSYDYLNLKTGITNGLVPVDSSPILSATNNLLIRPSELKTYLKVGLMSPEQKEAIPFIIEWIPDILPKCHVGELRIQLQYGHLRNGTIDKND
jgi:hypothetical protein